ncbi:MAG: CHASE2 domain-containing protein [Candidatus Omnitrophica bacterium]|nr:CHASE2 domain-containing protein [Candidatus Omnitrophota bacterium]
MEEELNQKQEIKSEETHEEIHEEPESQSEAAAPLSKPLKEDPKKVEFTPASLFKKLADICTDRRRIYEVLVGLFLLLVMSGVASQRWLDPFENLFLDLRFQVRGEKPFPQEITLVGIDEPSLDVFGRWPWPRDRHAALINILRQTPFRPAVVGFDILFENKNTSDPKGDDALVYQSGQLKEQMIMAYFFEKGSARSYEKDGEKELLLERFAFPPSKDDPEKLESYDKVSLPFLELSRSSGLAFANTPTDSDGRTRYAQLLGRYDGKIYPSMDLLAILAYLEVDIKDVQIERRAIVIEQSKVGRKVIPVNKKGELLINYYGESDDIPSVSFVGILEGAKAWMGGGKAQDLKALKGKIVLVGITALGMGIDRRATPFHQYEPGISLHAQVLANILENEYLRRAPGWASYLALIVTGFCVILATMFKKINRSLPTVLALQLLYFLVAQIFFSHGVWIDVAVQEVTMLTLFTGISSFRYFLALEELKRTQEQLIQSTKMASLGQLSAGIAHEFRNILNAVNLHIEYCSLPGTPPERVIKYLGTVKGIMTNANLILNGLLTFARKSESVKTPGRMKKTVEDTVLLVQKAMLQHTIELKTELEEVPKIAYDSGQISQVIMNLINNGRDAFKDKPEGREITLRLKSVPNGIQLDIADNGCGIPPQVMKRLFEPFVTSKPAGKGTGLGLSVCHGIIRNHGGDIKVTTAQGKGTTWHIFLPQT